MEPEHWTPGLEPKPSPIEFFSKHAAHYASSEGHARGSDLARLIELIEPRPSDEVLDVATGTGFTGLELAPHVRSVVGVDITEEMLAEARRLAGQRGVANVKFERGDAMRLPFSDSSFDIVTCRRASHHFADVSRFLAESYRALKPDGRLGIDDMSPPEGTQGFWNAIEILRDGTHVRALTEREWRSGAEEAGFVVTASEVLPEAQAYEKWLSPVKVGGSEDVAIQRAIGSWPRNVADAVGVRRAGGRVVGLTKSRIVMIAKKPGARSGA